MKDEAGSGRAVKWREVEEEFRSAGNSGSSVYACANTWRSTGVLLYTVKCTHSVA